MAAVKRELHDKFWVVGVPPVVFSEDPMVSLKSEFEGIFRCYSPEVQFSYIKPLSRVLVSYPDEESGQRALEGLKKTEFHGADLKVQSVKPVTIGERKLSLPAQTNRFFISPPSSPPVGWEPVEEPPPVVDYNLLSALSRLRKPGEAHEVLSGTTEAPSIVVIGCEDSAAKGTRPNISSARATETRIPRPSQ
ncbi:PREDICTED: calcipressin-1-like [Amphimedon queenslandica]|nr:PREDICTED: calcipressin-1-like [Amphimedon queenslandica]|eukprot:XP_011404173.1 PREDICTED: calcipressin-1-like [Amphimedon queenslandica]